MQKADDKLTIIFAYIIERQHITDERGDGIDLFAALSIARQKNESRAYRIGHARPPIVTAKRDRRRTRELVCVSHTSSGGNYTYRT